MSDIYDNPATRHNAEKDRWHQAANMPWATALAIISHSQDGDRQLAAQSMTIRAELPDDAEDWLMNGAWNGDETPESIKVEWDSQD